MLILRKEATAVTTAATVPLRTTAAPALAIVGTEDATANTLATRRMRATGITWADVVAGRASACPAAVTGNIAPGVLAPASRDTVTVGHTRTTRPTSATGIASTIVGITIPAPAQSAAPGTGPHLVIPDIHTTADAPTTRRMRATGITRADVVAGRTTGTSDPTPVPSAAPVVNTDPIPYYYTRWAAFYGEEQFAGPYDATALARLQARNWEITAEDIEFAVNGDDGIDPITFWNFPGSPAPMLEIARQHEKRMVDDKIRGWIEDGGLEGNMEREWEDEAALLKVGEVGELDVDEIAFGEEACKEVY